MAEEIPLRYVALRARGSSYAFVNDTEEGRTVKRFDVFKNGWTLAKRLAKQLNDEAMTRQSEKGSE